MDKIIIDFHAKANGSSNSKQAISCTVFKTDLDSEGSKKLDEIIQNDTLELLDAYTLLDKTDKSETIPLGVKTIPNDCFDGFMKFILGAILSLIGLGALLLTVCGGVGVLATTLDFEEKILALCAAVGGTFLFKLILNLFNYTDEKTIPSEYLLCFLFLAKNSEISKIVFRKCSYPKHCDICRSVDYFNQH